MKFFQTTLNCIFLAVGGLALADSPCQRANPSFVDKSGEIAEVNDFRECYGWFERYSSRSSREGACFSRDEVEKIIKRLNRKENAESDFRAVGESIIEIKYRKKLYLIRMFKHVGVPFSYEVVERVEQPLERTEEFRSYKLGKIFRINESSLDFSEEEHNDFGELRGKKFKARCKSGK